MITRYTQQQMRHIMQASTRSPAILNDHVEKRFQHEKKQMQKKYANMKDVVRIKINFIVDDFRVISFTVHSDSLVEAIKKCEQHPTSLEFSIFSYDSHSISRFLNGPRHFDTTQV